jgi:hypothetical protein
VQQKTLPLPKRRSPGEQRFGRCGLCCCLLRAIRPFLYGKIASERFLSTSIAATVPHRAL